MEHKKPNYFADKNSLGTPSIFYAYKIPLRYQTNFCLQNAALILILLLFYCKKCPRL